MTGGLESFGDRNLTPTCVPLSTGVPPQSLVVTATACGPLILSSSSRISGLLHPYPLALVLPGRPLLTDSLFSFSDSGVLLSATAPPGQGWTPVAGVQAETPRAPPCIQESCTHQSSQPSGWTATPATQWGTLSWAFHSCSVFFDTTSAF